jgi:hypothetical protein
MSYVLSCKQNFKKCMNSTIFQSCTITYSFQSYKDRATIVLIINIDYSLSNFTKSVCNVFLKEDHENITFKIRMFSREAVIVVVDQEAIRLLNSTFVYLIWRWTSHLDVAVNFCRLFFLLHCIYLICRYPLYLKFCSRMI